MMRTTLPSQRWWRSGQRPPGPVQSGAWMPTTEPSLLVKWMWVPSTAPGTDRYIEHARIQNTEAQKPIILMVAMWLSLSAPVGAAFEWLNGSFSETASVIHHSTRLSDRVSLYACLFHNNQDAVIKSI